MAKNPPTESQIAEQIAKGDQNFAAGQLREAYSSFNAAFDLAVVLHGSALAPALLPILERTFEVCIAASNEDWYMKRAARMLRSILYLTEKEHGIDSPKLIPVLERLVMFYDLDGAHMLAIEVKQRIDDIVARQSAS
jgi:hypothetical protein